MNSEKAQGKGMERSQAEKILGLLGLANRAGKLGVGFSQVDKMVRRGENPLVIMSNDVGASQKTRMERWEPVRGLVQGLLTGEEMAQALGRDKLAVLGVSDSGFVKGIMKIVNSDG
jgi:hypothetical protein